MANDHVGFGHPEQTKAPPVNKNWLWRLKRDALYAWRFTYLSGFFIYKSLPFIAGVSAGIIGLGIWDHQICHKDQWVELLPETLVRELKHQSKACKGGFAGLEKNETACNLFIAANKANGEVLQLEDVPKLQAIPKMVNPNLITNKMLVRLPVSSQSLMDKISRDQRPSKPFLADAATTVAKFGNALIKTAEQIAMPPVYANDPDYVDIPMPSSYSQLTMGGATCELRKNLRVPDMYRAAICSAARANGLTGNELAAQIKAESGFNPRAASRKRNGDIIAMGIAQITGQTARSWHVNPWDPYASINAMAYHVGRDMRTYQRQGHSRRTSLKLARGNYNGGSAAGMHFIRNGLRFLFNPRARRTSWDYETVKYLRRIEYYEQA